MGGPQAHWLPDGKRLHLNHGPIDLIIEAFGVGREVEAAYMQAVVRFETILTELVAELPELRRPGTPGASRRFHCSTARRMEAAIVPLAEDFITPMAAVAGSVADEIMTAMLTGRDLHRAYVNNGGDVALFLKHPLTGPSGHLSPCPGERMRRPHRLTQIIDVGASSREFAPVLSPGQGERWTGEAGQVRGCFNDCSNNQYPETELTIAIAGTGHGLADRLTIRASDPVRGIATSGWRGRSFSLGIADAVTVLARSGAQADAAATIIANGVDLPGHPAVRRQPANELAPDSDLGEMLVTVGVGALSGDDIADALASGLAVAEDLRHDGLIEAAVLFLAGECRVCGSLVEAPNTFTPLSVLPDISTANLEISGGAVAANLPHCGGDGRQGKRECDVASTAHASPLLLNHHQWIFRQIPASSPKECPHA